MSYESDWDTSYDDSYYQQQQEMQRQAAEAQRAAAAASMRNMPSGFAGSQQYGASSLNGYSNSHMDANAAHWAHRSDLAQQRSAYHDARTQQEFENNIFKEESARKKFDSETANRLGHYAEDTKRQDSLNRTSAMNNMTGALSGLTAGSGNFAGNSGNLSLYGASGQRIGGGSYGASPLKSLIG